MFASENVYSKSYDMYGKTVAYDHYKDMWTVELPNGTVELSRNDLEWEGADYNV
jgi:hypothetical protein